MNYYSEIRLKGDSYSGGFTNGFSLSGSETVQNMTVFTHSEEKTVYAINGQDCLTCYHQLLGDVTVCKSVFENKLDRTVTLELLSSFAVKGIKADKIHRATSFWSAEGKLLSQNLTDLNMEPSWAKHGVRIEKFGQVGSMPVRKWFPFLVLEDSKNGEFVGVQLYIGSSWQIEILQKDSTVTIQGGIADRDFGQWSKDLATGEKFETPVAKIAVGNSIYEVCNKLVKAQQPRIAAVDRDMPIVFNEYCTTWGNPSLDNIRRTAERLDGSGVRYLVIDSGWYRSEGEGDWFSKTGDWIPSKKLFPNGIKEVADIIKSHGLIPGLWYEFECLGGDAEGYGMKEHLVTRDGCPVTVGGRRFWDMRDNWVRNFLDGRVIGLLRDAGFGYMKVDYNENIGAGADGAESLGEGLRQCVEASRSYFKHITDELPELVIENCSSGGHRLEPSFMELASQASFSDAHECLSIPLIAANLHRLIRPEQSQIWAVLRADADESRINYLLTSSFLGRLCLSGEIFDLTDKQWQLALNAIEFYNEIKHIIKNGFTSEIRTDATDYTRPCGYQAVLREFNDEALLVVHTFEGGKNPPIDDLLSGYNVVKTFGSSLDGDFRGRAYLLRK
ncbi:MAG: alpha-galactosidase [Ruminococcaceae bacterium]|nr:alpha-galactosidase [Oscillospiraceae bacterium]